MKKRLIWLMFMGVSRQPSILYIIIPKILDFDNEQIIMCGDWNLC